MIWLLHGILNLQIVIKMTKIASAKIGLTYSSIVGENLSQRALAHFLLMPELKELIERSNEIREGIDYETAVLLNPTISRVEKETNVDVIRHMKLVSRLLDDEIDRMSYKLGM